MIQYHFHFFLASPEYENFLDGWSQWCSLQCHFVKVFHVYICHYWGQGWPHSHIFCHIFFVSTPIYLSQLLHCLCYKYWLSFQWTFFLPFDSGFSRFSFFLMIFFIFQLSSSGYGLGIFIEISLIGAIMYDIYLVTASSEVNLLMFITTLNCG